MAYKRYRTYLYFSTRLLKEDIYVGVFQPAESVCTSQLQNYWEVCESKGLRNLDSTAYTCSQVLQRIVFEDKYIATSEGFLRKSAFSFPIGKRLKG